jgi:nitrogen regulatory protein P-II 1
MKKLEAIIRPHKIDEVKDRLLELGIQGMTVSEVKGFGRQRGHDETYRGSEYIENFIPKIKLELVLPGDKVGEAIEAIRQVCRSGKIGDGKIWITPVEHLLRIRTGETGDDAL